ncbi:hypothetical protein [Sphingopyxis sp.]
MTANAGASAPRAASQPDLFGPSLLPGLTAADDVIDAIDERQ